MADGVDAMRLVLAQVEEFKRVLDFYADPRHYIPRGDAPPLVKDDNGRRAREVLGKYEA